MKIYQFTSVRISFFCGTEQFRENGFDHYTDDRDFYHVKQWVTKILRDRYRDDLRANKSCQPKKYWAMFQTWNSELQMWVETAENFQHRIKL